MNKCPKCGETAVSTFDKLFKTNHLVCQRCGQRLQVSSITSMMITIAVFILSVGVWSLNLTTMIKVSILVLLFIIAAIIYYVLPLQIKLDAP